jgi:hypothetical protein
VNYLLGNDKSKWKTNIPTFGRVNFTGVYPGIDLAYYGHQGRLEYDFTIAPHADPSRIIVAFSGGEPLTSLNGKLNVETNGSSLTIDRPIAYQTIDGCKEFIRAGYRVNSNKQVSFEIKSYNHALPLVIDPVIEYSTFLAGEAPGFSSTATSIAVDSLGDSYVTGTTLSSDFPTTSGSFEPTVAASVCRRLSQS